MVFSSVKQYYQYTKAETCNYHERAKKILDCSDPRHIKELGDGIHRDDIWVPHRGPTLYAGTLAKFQQNPTLAIALVSTGTSKLYEATTDKFFGCGISLLSKKWTNKEWTGENVVGRILMKVRYELSGMNPEFGVDESLDVLAGNISNSTNDSQLESSANRDNMDQSTSTSQVDNLATQSSNDSSQSKSGKKKKRSHHRSRRGRGRGRGSYANLSNVTERSSHRQSGYN